MSKTTELIKEKSLGILLASIAGVFCYLFAIVWSEMSVPFVQKILPNISNKALLAVVVIQFALILALLVWLRLLHHKIAHLAVPEKPDVLANYEFDKRLGIYKNKISGLYYCTSCLQSGLESPLQESASQWTCQVKTCAKIYYNPDYKSPDPPFNLHERRKSIFDGY